MILPVVLISSCQVQKSTKSLTDKPLFTINDDAVSKEDFKYAFLKNYRPNDSLTLEEDVREYLDLYIKFKLKVNEARSLGYADRKSYIEELNKYQKDLAKPYLTESKVTEELIEETYNRLQTEIKASHILIRLQEGTSDTTEAWNKIQEIRDLALKGHSFDSLAVKYSEDPSAKMNKGSLGYFTALQMVYPFENAAYATPVGEVSEPVKTRFGYHLIYVSNKRKARGKLRVAHIMIRTPQNQSEADSVKSKEKIDAIYKEILDGQDWKQLVADYSEDPGSKNKGGELPWFGTGNFVPEFEEVAYSLDSSNIYSKPFKTIYGWHIIKYIDKKDLEPLESMRSEIERKIGRDSRTKVKNQVVLDRIKNENGFKKYNDNISSVISLLDSGNLASEDGQKILFEIGDKSFKGSDLETFAETRKNLKKSSGELYEMFEREMVLDFENKQLEFKYPEYRALLNEYRDGILLFDVMEEMVWQKASQDSTGLASYYKNNQSRYIKKDVVLTDIYTSKSKQTIDTVEFLINKSKDRASIENQLNKDEPLNLQVRSGHFARGEHPLVEKNNEVGLHRYEENNRHILVHIKENKPTVIPELNEIKGKVISDYQDYLEATWVEELKSRYQVKVNDDILKKVISEIEVSI